MLILHVKLLCEMEKDLLLNELKTFDYPLVECLEICKAYNKENKSKDNNVFEATSYLLERMGAILDSIKIYCKLFKKSLIRIVRTIM